MGIWNTVSNIQLRPVWIWWVSMTSKISKTKTTNWHTSLDNQASTRKSHTLRGPAIDPNPIPSTGRPAFMKIGAEHWKT
jgi:hypothetical protein